MKRMIAWLLLVTMLLGVFAGCGNAEQTPNQTNPVAGDVEGINAAIDYLKAFYKDGGTETFADFDRFGIVRIGGVPYEVVWTADVSEDLVKAVVNEDGSVTIDVNENCEESTPYVLTATVSDDAGNTASNSWEYILPVGLGNDYGAIVDMAYELEVGEALTFNSTLVGTVTVVNTPWSEEYKNITVTIIVAGSEDKPIECYRLKGDGAQDLAPGDLITVTGVLKNYNGKIEFDSGCVLDKVEKGAGTLGDVPTDPHEIVDSAYALEEGASLPFAATLTGVITSIDTPYDSGYNNITVTIQVEGREDKPIMCYRLKGEGVEDLYISDTITVTGVLKNYSGTIEFDAGCQLVEVVKGDMEKPVAPEDPAEIVKAAYSLQAGESLPYEATLTGRVVFVASAYSQKYQNITVTIAVGDKPIICYRLKGDEANTLNNNDIITVTGTLMNYNGFIEFGSGSKLVSVEQREAPKQPSDPKEVVDAAYALRPGFYLPYYPTLTGTITKINTAYSEQYGNITVTMVVAGREDKPIKCYRMSGAGADDLAVGDTITVKGYVVNYIGKYDNEIEYSKPKLLKVVKAEVPETPELTGFAKDLADAAKLANKSYLDRESTITGTITNDPKASSYTEGQYDFTVTDGTNTVRCYFVPVSGGTPKKGDTVTVTGKLTAYNGTPQFDSKSSAVLSAGETELTGFAKDLADAAKLANKSYLDRESTITATIVSEVEISTKVEGTYRFTISDGINSVLCYWIPVNTTPKNGDVITVTGKLTAYNGTPQFDSNSNGVVSVGEPELTGLAKDLADAAELANKSYLDRTSTITGTITNDPKASSYTEGQYDFTVTDGTHTIRCYFVPVSGGTPKKGDTVTVTGQLTAYNGTPQFDSKSSAALAGGSETPEEPETPTEPETPEVPTLSSGSTAAEILAACQAAEKGYYFDGVTVTIEGTVTWVGTPSTNRGDVTFSLDNGLEVYRLKCDVFDQIAKGDYIVVSGIPGNRSTSKGTPGLKDCTLVNWTDNTP